MRAGRTFSPVADRFFPSNRPGMSDPCGIIVGMGKVVSDGVKRAYKYRFYPSGAQPSFLVGVSG